MPRHHHGHHGHRHHHHDHHHHHRHGSPGRRHGGMSAFGGGSSSWGGGLHFDDGDDFMERIRSRFRNRPGGRYGSTNVYVYGNDDVNNDNGNWRSFSGTAPPPKPDRVKILTVRNVDLNVPANTKAHRTDEYDICGQHQRRPKLVVRRGQPFNIDLDFSKPYDSKTDDLRIVFEAGDNPSPAKGTDVQFILSDVDKPREWGAKILRQQDNMLTVTVFVPPTCYVGKWDLKLDVVKKDNNDVAVYRYEHEDPIYIIFNPWCRDDAVFLDDENLLQEYVLNETGKIYSGSKKQISSKPWNFGQFESCVLDVAMYLLEISEVQWPVRGNPIPVIRKISAAVNSSDEGGVLVGNWSGNYSAGRSPLSWTGSVAILESYWDSKRPVRFGQCWVFSGLCTTIARALGIPARSVTNFSSAHDTDGSMTIDIVCDKDGSPDDYNPDSIWNFHVWNEAWMARPDLPTGFGGWQAFDATPQETSDGTYCCGPVSVAAIRQGEVNMPFDAPFVFAEVNADRVYWMPDVTGTVKNVFTEAKLVGKSISTKMPNSDEREDVTLQYKPKEGSAEERAAVLKANQLASTRENVYDRVAKDVDFEVEQDAANTWVGEDFKVALKFTNRSDEERTVSGRLVIKTMFYTGVPAEKIVSFPFENKVLQRGASDTVPVTVSPFEYLEKLKDCCMLDVSVWASVRETNQCFVIKDDCRLRKPHLNVKAPQEAVKGKEFKVEVSFMNPLDTTLTECEVTVDGLARSLRFPQGSVGAKSTFVASIPITPAKVGQKEMIFCFSSKQLEDINASKRIFVRASNI
ncbi:hemocyte protein-glutamine gamma-glutamyltransferase [Aplysia californica]|uniref:Hemocyte protein-glutamine gamma-glutamyltransferase n=1 Tax=Aplysia californica TaxID=6500 RepID=A0ABM1A029_APLCA|nr:hemocyte protein-glutamine gamma-glutamyltransferase [Aplysia californica]